MKGYGVIVHETQHNGYILFAFVVRLFVRHTFVSLELLLHLKSDFKNSLCILLLMTCRCTIRIIILILVLQRQQGTKRGKSHCAIRSFTWHCLVCSMWNALFWFYEMLKVKGIKRNLPAMFEWERHFYRKVTSCWIT